MGGGRPVSHSASASDPYPFGGLIKRLLRSPISANGASISDHEQPNQERRAAEPCLINRELDPFLVISSRSTNGISRRIIAHDEEHRQPEDDGGEEPRRVRVVAAGAGAREAALLESEACHAAAEAPCALSFGYDLKSYSQNFDDGLVPAHRL